MSSKVERGLLCGLKFNPGAGTSGKIAASSIWHSAAGFRQGYDGCFLKGLNAHLADKRVRPALGLSRPLDLGSAAAGH